MRIVGGSPTIKRASREICKKDWMGAHDIGTEYLPTEGTYVGRSVTEVMGKLDEMSHCPPNIAPPRRRRR